MGLRDRLGGGSDLVRYQMREKMFSIGDDAWIEDANGVKAFKVDGKALRVRSTFVLEDAAGNEVASVQGRMLRVRDTMEIERGGRPIATIKKALVAPLRDRFKVDLHGQGEWEVQGNVLDHEYEISDGRSKVAEVSKKWFRVRDTYGIEVSPGQDDALVIAVAVAVDEMRRGD